MVETLGVIQIVSIVLLLACWLGFFGRLGARLVIPVFIVVVCTGTALAIMVPPYNPGETEECGSGPMRWEC